MKNLIILIWLAIPYIAFSQPREIEQFGQTPEQKQFGLDLEGMNNRNEVALRLQTIEVITSDSIYFFAKKIVTYWPMFDETIFLVLTGAEEDIPYQYVFKSDRKNPKKFVKLKFESLDYYTIEKFEYYYNQLSGSEDYLISCKDSWGKHHEFVYNLKEDTLKRDNIE